MVLEQEGGTVETDSEISQSAQLIELLSEGRVHQAFDLRGHIPEDAINSSEIRDAAIIGTIGLLGRGVINEALKMSSKFGLKNEWNEYAKEGLGQCIAQENIYTTLRLIDDLGYPAEGLKDNRLQEVLTIGM